MIKDLFCREYPILAFERAAFHQIHSVERNWLKTSKFSNPTGYFSSFVKLSGYFSSFPYKKRKEA
jgi:hypothetical protein